VPGARTGAVVFPPDEEVIGSFGEFLQTSAARHTALAEATGKMNPRAAIDSGLMWELRPHLRKESELPYPVATIRAAIERMLVGTDDPRLYEHLRVSLVCLREYAPDAEVPTDKDENVR
jgi:hypothetical protein